MKRVTGQESRGKRHPSPRITNPRSRGLFALTYHRNVGLAATRFGSSHVRKRTGRRRDMDHSFDDDTALSILQRNNPLDTAFLFYRDEGTTRDE